jgi:hypothetical protein
LLTAFSALKYIDFVRKILAGRAPPNSGYPDLITLYFVGVYYLLLLLADTLSLSSLVVKTTLSYSLIFDCHNTEIIMPSYCHLHVIYNGQIIAGYLLALLSEK